MSYYQSSNNVLRSAIRDSVINPTLPAIQKWGDGNIILRKLMDTVEKQARGRVNSPWLGKQSSWQLPQTRRFQQSRAPSETPLVQPVPGSPWMVELARYPVPVGSVGVIKSFEQYLSQDQTVFSTSDQWGNPFPTVDVRWFLRLSQVHRIGSPWINVSGASAIVDYLPGNPYDDLAETNGLWFPAGSSTSANIHLPIPGGQFLRLIAILPSAAGEPVNIFGRLYGSTQLELNDEAQEMLRLSW